MDDQGPEPAVPVKVKPRLRLSLFDFNPSFIKSLIFLRGKITGCTLNTALLDAFEAARIDDYSLVRTISFIGANDENYAHKPGWRDFSPGGSGGEALRVDYLQKLTQEMHNRGAQVTAGYELVERGTSVSQRGTLFRRWLESATAEQVSKHAEDIVDFFVSRQIPIDGIGFDFELNGLGSAHASNLAVLFSETAKLIASARPGAFVYYDTAPFQPKDGEGSSPNMEVLKYSLAKSPSNLIARPMCYNGVVTSESRIEASINCALSTSKDGGGLTASHLQCAIDVSRTSDPTVQSMCTNLFRPNLVGMTVYTMPGPRKQTFLKKVGDLEAVLNPGSPPPGTPGEPHQVPELLLI